MKYRRMCLATAVHVSFLQSKQGKEMEGNQRRTTQNRKKEGKKRYDEKNEWMDWDARLHKLFHM